MKILVVDDEQMIRDLAVKILTRAGHEVMTAESGREGIAAFEKSADEIGLVLMDVTLNDLSGTDAIREIRLISPDIPCILSSGRNFEEITLPGDLVGQIHYLEKPYRARQLSSLVNDILEI